MVEQGVEVEVVVLQTEAQVVARLRRVAGPEEPVLQVMVVLVQ
tara:strand:+ start:598 stop:726 length:129 start_codon:yes stop_codon:yes gene_type:complete